MKKEPRNTASHEALSQHAKKAASRRKPSERSTKRAKNTQASHDLMPECQCVEWMEVKAVAATGLDVTDKSRHATNQWLDEISAKM